MFHVPQDIPWIREVVAKLAPMALTEDQLARLVTYTELVSTWDRRHNLTGAKKPQELVEILLADALVLSSLTMVSKDARVIDVGAGAGAPVIPLALLRQDIRGLLVEPRQKRAAFLRYAIGVLDLGARLSVSEARLDPKHPEAVMQGQVFDVAMSRATFNPPEWQSLGLKLAPQCLVLGTDGLKAVPIPTEALMQQEYEYQWPFSEAPRHIRVLFRMNR